jgi:hypothetical protein
MRTVVLRLSRSGDFSAAMIKMRSWLDANGCSSFRFKYHLNSDTVLAKVEFTKENDAQAFRRRFATKTDDANPLSLHMHETMEQACWWRLMAEEIRAKADEFNSEDAKETMAQVATCYDRMADDLEKRLANPRYRNGLVVG